jgi:hypothetical protein
MTETSSKINTAAMYGRSWIEKNLDKQNFSRGYCGACAWAATYVLCRLHQEGVSAHVAISKIPGGQHAFVVTDNYIVDVTATQFADSVTYYPEVVVYPRRKRHEYFWRDVMARLHTPEDVVTFCKDPAWPREQIPNIKRIKETYENF